MTVADLAALVELERKATPGEWRTNECSHGGLILRRDGILQTHLQVVPDADANLIAAIRNAAPALLAVVVAAVEWDANGKAERVAARDDRIDAWRRTDHAEDRLIAAVRALVGEG